ncbi:hypothetical protein CASFOL_041383 [Castilleja foliolosa]|uniref:Uncharacterized protein n=1 Tax=Castilleja foliolosa TaxID=1961234 RepID=A0ABD3BFZ0_9LAMI
MGKKVEENDETEQNSFSTLKFPFLPFPAATIHSPDHPPPPLHTLASVPFKWEEQPGKPRPCTDIIPLPIPGPGRIILEPPPCRITTAVDPSGGKITKMPSPTAVLDGPYAVARPKFSSFRFLRESFDSTSSDSPYSSEDVLLGGGRRKGRGFFGRGLRFKSGKKEVDEGSLGFSPSSTTGFSDERFKMRKNGSLKSVSPRFCATIYERLKQAVPWKSTRKSRKNECNV